MAAPAPALHPPCRRLRPAVVLCPFLHGSGSTAAFLLVCLVVGGGFLWFSCVEHVGTLAPDLEAGHCVPFADKTRGLDLTVRVPCDPSCGPQVGRAVRWMHVNGSSAAAQLLESKDVSQTISHSCLPKKQKKSYLFSDNRRHD